jgi:tetratricopeptide (TPR) repeat protein
MLTTTDTKGATISVASNSAARARGIEGLYATAHWLLTGGRPADAASVFRAMLLVAHRDERSWLGLGACHEAVDQPLLALELYGAAQAVLPGAVRCRLARARILRASGRDDEADDALASAEDIAEELGDETLLSMVVLERRAASTP